MSYFISALLFYSIYISISRFFLYLLFFFILIFYFKSLNSLLSCFIFTIIIKFLAFLLLLLLLDLVFFYFTPLTFRIFKQTLLNKLFGYYFISLVKLLYYFLYFSILADKTKYKQIFDIVFINLVFLPIILIYTNSINFLKNNILNIM